MRALLFSLLTLAACKDDAPAMVDAPKDSPSGGPCTGAAYDPCTTNDQCMSMNCHFYMQSNFTVCVTTCTAGDNSTCPVDATGAHGVCNTMGICKPAMPNNCTR